MCEMRVRREVWVSDRGESLVEVLVTVVILGIAAVAILAGVQLSVKSSDLGRKEANGGTYVRSLAESVQNAVANGGYATCGGTGYLTSTVKADAGLPAAYTASSAISAWNGNSWVACSSSNDAGIQRLDLSVTSPGTGAHQAVEKLSVIVRKPCSGSLPSPC
jgi:prepilin-type N-terminal cleavage/methylation domain-containing protein